MSELRQRSLIFVELLRMVVVGVFAIVGYQLGSSQAASRGPNGVLLGVLLSTATGYVLGGVFGRGTASAIGTSKSRWHACRAATSWPGCSARSSA